MSKIGVSLIDMIFKILSSLGLMAMVFCFLSPYVPPQSIGWLQVFGLAAPIILIYNFMLFLYWIIRFKPFALVAIVTLLIGLNPALRICRLSLKNEAVVVPSGVRIVSYNVRGFTDSDYRMKNVEILKDIKALKPDIIAFQEFSTVGNNSLDKVNASLASLRHRRVLYFQKYTKQSGYGIALYSRYPILKYEEIVFDKGGNGAMMVDIRVKGDTIRVFNIHLQSTTLKHDERLMLSDKDLVSNIGNDKGFGKLMQIVSKISTNSSLRQVQAKKIAKEIEASPYKVIVCGDFNDSPNSYTYNTIRGDLQDSFMEAGRGYGSSFKDFFSLMRIDFILCDKDFQIDNYSTAESKFSDHYPIITEITL